MWKGWPCWTASWQPVKVTEQPTHLSSAPILCKNRCIIKFCSKVMPPHIGTIVSCHFLSALLCHNVFLLPFCLQPEWLCNTIAYVEHLYLYKKRWERLINRNDHPTQGVQPIITKLDALSQMLWPIPVTAEQKPDPRVFNVPITVLCTTPNCILALKYLPTREYICICVCSGFAFADLQRGCARPGRLCTDCISIQFQLIASIYASA